MGKRLCANSGRCVGSWMRVLVATNFLAALSLLIFGCTVERPINSFPPIAMIILAFLSLGSGIAGLVGGHKCHCFLDVFLVLHSLDTLCKAILVIVLWTNFGGVVHAIDPGQTGAYSAARVLQVLTAAKWLLLVFLLCEIVSLALALVLRFVLGPQSEAQAYDNFDDANLQERNASMAHLRSDMESARVSTTSGAYESVTAKMAKKYGAFSNGIKWKRGWFW